MGGIQMNDEILITVNNIIEDLESLKLIVKQLEEAIKQLRND
jgi:hypothetical protein